MALEMNAETGEIRKILPPDEVWKLFESRLRSKKFKERNQGYDQRLEYFEGKQNKSGGNMVPNSALGKPVLRLGTATETPMAITANRIAPIVLDHQALVGRMPNSRTEPPSQDDKGFQKAEKQDKFLVSTYEMCSLELQHVQAGFFLSALGDALYALDVDWPQKRVTIVGIDPRYAFPSWRVEGWRRFELYDVVIARPLDPDQLKNQYGYEPHSDRPEDCTVVTYMSPWQRTIVIGKEELFMPNETVPWNMGFCPAVWLHNYFTTDGSMGNSDVSQILGLQDFYNFAVNVRADGLYEMTYPLRGIKDPLEVGEGGQVPIGPGETIALGEKGDIITSAPVPPPQASEMILAQVTSDMNSAAGTSDVRQQGMPDRSNISGRAIQAAQGPESTRLDIKQVIQAHGFMQLNRFLFAMQEKAPLLGDDPFEIFGRLKGQPFQEQFNPKEDIAGWYRTAVTWEALLGINKQQKLFVASEARKTGLIDDIEAMEMMGVDDPMGMRKRIESDRMNQAELEARVQMKGQEIAQQAQQQSPGQPQMPQQGPGAGQQGQPPQPIFRPPQMASQPPAGGAPQGVTLNVLRQVVGSIPGLKGAVYAIGEIAMKGTTDSPQIAITDYTDHSKVVPPIRALAPAAKVTYVAEDKLPSLKERLN